MTSPDSSFDRPSTRPQFGEYATPEEQRRAIKVPDVHSEPESAVAEPVSPKQPDQKAGSDAVAAAPDRLATYTLLAIGLFSALSTVPMLLDLPATITRAYAQLGVSDFTSDATASVVGWVVLVVQFGLWVLALLLSLRQIGRGKRSWWIPLVIGVVANLILIVSLMILMMIDPAFTEYVNTMTPK